MLLPSYGERQPNDATAWPWNGRQSHVLERTSKLLVLVLAARVRVATRSTCVLRIMRRVWLPCTVECSCSMPSLFSRTQSAYSRSLACTLAPLLPSASPCVLVPRAGVVATTRVAVAAVVLRLALPAHPGCAVEPAATGGAVCTVELASRG